MVDMVEVFSFFGFPARLAGRALLAFRYVSNRGATAKVTGDYAELRFGKTVRWRPWLMIDVKELEEIESMINRGTDAQVEGWRVSQLSVCGMIAIIGALVASAGVTALQLPGLEDCHFVARGTFVMSLIMSLMSVFFSGLQQSSFGRASDAKDLRIWLASGGFWNDKTMKTELRSSMVAHMILQAPFEIVVMSITLFIVGFGTYLGSSWKLNLPLTTGPEGNRAVMIAFIVPTVFVLIMYGHMMGLKDRELVKATDVSTAQMMAEKINLKLASTGDIEANVHRDSDNAACIKSTTIAVLGLSGLREALQAAADAQRKCAQANEEVAKQYEQLLRDQ